MFYRHNREIAPMNSQHTQELPKLIPDKSPSMKRGSEHTVSHPIPKAGELLAIDSSWEKEIQFSLRVWPLIGNYSLIEGYTLRSMSSTT